VRICRSFWSHSIARGRHLGHLAVKADATTDQMVGACVPKGGGVLVLPSVFIVIHGSPPSPNSATPLFLHSIRAPSWPRRGLMSYGVDLDVINLKTRRLSTSPSRATSDGVIE
jgi:hypothetical protein